MKRDYDQICALYKEKEKNRTIAELEYLKAEIELEIKDLLDRHECLAARLRAYQYLIDEKNEK